MGIEFVWDTPEEIIGYSSALKNLGYSNLKAAELINEWAV